MLEREIVTAISRPTYCASNAGGPVRSPLPRKSTISCRCPLPVVVFADFIILQCLDNKINVAERLELMAYIAFEKLKAAPLFQVGGKQSFLGNAAVFG